MMRRSTGIVVGVFVILLILAFALQRDRETQVGSATPLAGEEFLLGVRSEGINALTITDAGGGRVELARSGEAWRLSGLSADLTDQGRVTTAVSQLENMVVARTFADQPALAPLGLTEPAFVLTITWDGVPEEQVLVGDQTPTQDSFYVLGPGDKLSVVNQFAMDMVLDLLRDPPLALTPFPTPEATSAPGP